MDDFVHLHLHSEYSLLDGAIKINELPKRVKELGMHSVAITDHGSMYGIIEFYKACLKENIKPIIGCEVYVARKNRFSKEGKSDASGHHLILLAKDNQGYENLIKIVSRSYKEGFYYKPRVDKDLLREYSEGLICTSACLAGEIPRYLLSGLYDEAKKVALEYEEIFGQGNFYLEVQNHYQNEDRILIREVIRLSEDTKIPMVAANDAHYLCKEDAKAHEILMCIQMGKTIMDEDKLEFPNDEFYLKSPQEMVDLFPNLKSAISNTVDIAKRCNVTFTFGENYMPDFLCPDNMGEMEYLRKLCYEGITKKYGDLSPKIKERLEYELGVISNMGYPGYFLIVWDMINYARRQGISVGPGRGSAAGSLVAYVLNITNIDPFKFDLIFERFLNPERISLPDIDTDFCYKRRGEVIDYLVRKYGEDRVAQIITFGTMGARSVIRDVGRAMDVSLRTVDQIAKMIPFEIGITIKKAMENSVELREAYEQQEIKELIDIARKLEGMPRHASTHAAAVVISKKPLDNYLPLRVEGDLNVTTQFPMSTVEELGLLKMDLLGLRTLTVINDCLINVKRNYGIEVDIDLIDLDQEETYKLLETGHTAGIFQLESRGMQQIIKKLKPDTLEDIIALVALYRPGPLGSGMINDFIDRKHGRLKIEYPHESLEPVLKETYGVILYQEQVMKIANVLAGFSLAQGDNLRKAMGKKKIEIIEKIKKEFIDGAEKNGVDRQKASDIYALIEYFAGYGFNKSHSAAYGLLAYETAYLKCNYPKEFMAALMSSMMGATEKISFYILECRKLGIELLLPDINESEGDFIAKENGIRLGLGIIKGVGKNSIMEIIREREENGKYKSVEDLIMRVSTKSISKSTFSNFILCGVFDSFGWSRNQLFLKKDDIMEKAQRMKKDKESNQLSLFDLAGAKEEARDETPLNSKEYDDRRLLAFEKEFLGIYLSSHPLDEYAEYFKGYDFKVLDEIEDELDGQVINIKGIISKVIQRRTRKNESMASIVIDDELGSIEVIVFPRLYNEKVELLKEGEILVVKGRAQITERDKKILGEKILKPIQLKKKGKIVKIVLDANKSKEELLELKNILRETKGNTLNVTVVINGKEIPLNKSFAIDLNEEVKRKLENYGEVVI